MSKELETLYTPLQSLNNIRDNYFLLKGKDGTDLEYRWFNRIETALKRKEELEKMHTNALEKIAKDRKKLKALEIIKEKFRILEPIGFDVKKDSIAFGCIIQKKDLTQEEYDLLKEIKDRIIKERG